MRIVEVGGIVGDLVGEVVVPRSQRQRGLERLLGGGVVEELLPTHPAELLVEGRRAIRVRAGRQLRLHFEDLRDRAVLGAGVVAVSRELEEALRLGVERDRPVLCESPDGREGLEVVGVLLQRAE